jgi:hypothetical protein
MARIVMLCGTTPFDWISKNFLARVRACAHPDFFDKNGQNYTKRM